MTSPTPRDQQEYTALRTTVRERGTARIQVFVGGLLGWAALTIATAAVIPTPVATLVPLLALAGVFEGVYALHIGVERIGRYIHVFHEAPELASPGWEHVVAAFGKPKGVASVDALFTVPFVLATAFNIMPALIANPTGEEIVFVGGAHALFAIRLFAARAVAARQRTVDEQRFAELKRGVI